MLIKSPMRYLAAQVTCLLQLSALVPNADPLRVTLGFSANSTHTRSCRGYLTKQGGSGPFKNWRRRWFELKEDNCLYYYKDKTVSAQTVSHVANPNTLPSMFPVACKLKHISTVSIFCHCQEKDPLGAILLINYTLTRAPEVNRKHTFKIVKYGQRDYFFQADSEEDMNRSVSSSMLTLKLQKQITV